jgi:Txe/YoeB family toxin of toxin-antitoxin system
MYKTVLTKQAYKDLAKLSQSGLSEKAKELTRIVQNDPYKTPPQFEKLSGDLEGYYSRRINRQHRFVYDVLPNIENLVDNNNVPYDGIVKILRMWTHYE